MANETISSWFPFENRAPLNFVDEPVVSCYLGKVFHFSRGRNAYWGRWSSAYPGHESFAIGLAEAEERVQGRRVQGSRWSIKELPVLVITSKEKIPFFRHSPNSRGGNLNWYPSVSRDSLDPVLRLILGINKRLQRRSRSR
jgi:hypothetical protein